MKKMLNLAYIMFIFGFRGLISNDDNVAWLKQKVLDEYIDIEQLLNIVKTSDVICGINSLKYAAGIGYYSYGILGMLLCSLITIIAPALSVLLVYYIILKFVPSEFMTKLNNGFIIFVLIVISEVALSFLNKLEGKMIFHFLYFGITIVLVGIFEWPFYMMFVVLVIGVIIFSKSGDVL